MPTRAADDAFSASRARFEQVCCFMGGEEASSLTHAELEERLSVQGRELIRQLYQDHLDLRAATEQRLGDVIDANDTPRRAVEAGHARGLETIFGEVGVTRLAYRRRGEENLYPADAVLNLPTELHSHGLRELCAIESDEGKLRGGHRGDPARDRRSDRKAPGGSPGGAFCGRLRGVLPGHLARRGRRRRRPVLSADGKGIVMRPDALRPHTAKAAQTTTPKLKTRLSKGEKRNRKRMAEVGAVYDATRVPRSPTDIIRRGVEDKEQAPAPKAKNKWLTASVVDDAAVVISSIVDSLARSLSFFSVSGVKCTSIWFKIRQNPRLHQIPTEQNAEF